MEWGWGEKEEGGGRRGGATAEVMVVNEAKGFQSLRL